MAGNQSPQRSSADGANLGWSAVGYLMSGIAFWGFVGWAVDRWLVHTGGVATAIGAILGVVAAIYLIVKRLSV
jgi:ATP synthase protein I